MRVFRIIQPDEDPQPNSAIENGTAVGLIAAALIGMVLAATAAWIYVLYRAAYWLLD
jgi:hypothetical protein